uniref:Serine hydrolase domain-containing protein n=1 Tax=Ditylum brightwellii TaxID=49249 RepID=A0A6V2JXL1_9STRA
MEPTKMRILCLHGKFQNGSAFANKIGGAKRKLSRVYDLHFLDGPIPLEDENENNSNNPKAWWLKDEETGKHINIEEAFEYVKEITSGQTYDAILGFSQGGTLATGLAIGGVVPGVRAVVTAGSPFVQDVLDVAKHVADATPMDDNEMNLYQKGFNMPKFHMAGETDQLISVDSTKLLCENGGNGQFVVHEKGHLFPTRAALVNQVMEFLEISLCDAK